MGAAADPRILRTCLILVATVVILVVIPPLGALLVLLEVGVGVYLLIRMVKNPTWVKAVIADVTRNRAVPRTSYGTWDTESAQATMRDTVRTALGNQVDNYDLNQLVTAYRRAINRALPDGVLLTGDTFSGPPPVPTRARDEIDAAIGSVDLPSLALGYIR